MDVLPSILHNLKGGEDVAHVLVGALATEKGIVCGAGPIASKSVPDLKNAVYELIVSLSYAYRTKPIQRIHSDWESAVISQKIRGLLVSDLIQVTHTQGGDPAGNGLCESYVGALSRLSCCSMSHISCAATRRRLCENLGRTINHRKNTRWTRNRRSCFSLRTTSSCLCDRATQVQRQTGLA